MTPLVDHTPINELKFWNYSFRKSSTPVPDLSGFSDFESASYAFNCDLRSHSYSIIPVSKFIGITAEARSDSIQNLRSLYLDSIPHGRHELILHSGLSLRVDFSEGDGIIIAFNESFGIYGSGSNLNSALEDFNNSFIEFYMNIVLPPEDNLGESTLRVRNALKAFARLVEHE